MTDINLRSDNVDVEQIMRQIRARIREKRGVDYTEDEIRELAAVKLEKFLDPRGVRSDLLEQFRRKREASLPPNFVFEDTTIFETHRSLLRFIRRLLRPVLKLFFNPNPLAEALNIQSKLNAQQAALEPLHYEVLHNLVVETTRLGIEVKNLKMRVESMSSRLDFDERRARALEGVVVYRPGAAPPLQPPAGGGESRPPAEGPDSPERRARRRRRRGRRRPLDSREGSPAQGRPLDSRDSAQGRPPDSREGASAQGRPLDSREGSPAQGRPLDSRDGAQGRPADSREGASAQGRPGDRGEGRPDAQPQGGGASSSSAPAAPQERPATGNPGDGGAPTES
jgi:hypothetical protein